MFRGPQVKAWRIFSIGQGIIGLNSPLTPALSPLRGEGVALEARGNWFGPRRVLGAIERLDSTSTTVMSAAMKLTWLADIRLAPSPLNGERAGVRGEITRAAS